LYLCQRMNEGRIYHILLMAAYLWPEGQRVQKDPAGYVRQFIEKNYGEQAVTDGMAVLKTLRSQNKMLADRGSWGLLIIFYVENLDVRE